MRKPNENYDSDIIRDIEERKELPDATPEEIERADKISPWWTFGAIVLLLVVSIATARGIWKLIFGL